MEEMLSVQDVSKILKISRQKVYALINSKKLTGFRVDSRYRVKLADLKEYLKDREV